MKTKIIEKIIDRTEARLADLPPVRGHRLFGTDRHTINAEITAANAAREQVADEAISAILAEWPAEWPAWKGALVADKESEFHRMVAILRNMN